MGFECSCPNPATLPDVVISTCPFNIKQLQKAIVQRRGFQFDGTLGKDIVELADWLALKVAVDDTKISVGPKFGGDPIITAGEAITVGGGDNTTMNGVEETTGVNPSVFTAIYKNITPEEKVALQALFCETNLVVWLVNEDENIVCDEVAVGVYEGFPIEGKFFVGDRNNTGYAGNDTFSIKFSLKAGWDDNLAIVPVNFNPLVDLD